MPKFTTLGFHHVTLVARDLRQTIPFYRDLLGFNVASPVSEPASPEQLLYLTGLEGAPGTIVAVRETPLAAPGRYGTGGIHHHAFGTESRETLLQWKRWLNSNGVATSGPMERGYFTSLYFRDPDGQVLEIATRGPGYAIDEPMQSLGATQTTPATYQLPGGRDERGIAAETWPDPVVAITWDMNLQGLHHVTGMTDDLQRADEFYQSALGLRLVKRSVNQDDPDTPHLFWANYDGTRVLHGSSLTFFGWPSRAPRARAGVGQTERVAFRAADADALAEWRDHLLSLQVAVSPPTDHTFYHAITFQAPDGLALEIATDAPGFAPEQHVSSASAGGTESA